MSFIGILGRAKAHLSEQGRLSLRALQREFELDDDTLDEIVDELVDVQRVATREGRVLSWVGPALPGTAREAEPTPPDAGTASAATTEATAPHTEEAERRQLTVMFCDLVGSTDLSRRLDAEELRDVVRAYQNAASGPIERHEGRVAQYLGDGLLVYFGYPHAHEDDAQRGVLAGLEILRALRTLNDSLEREHGIRLAARIGIHTGPVVIGEMGSGAKSETLALGDTANISAHLQRIAEPDSVVISEATLRLVPGLFLTEDLGTPTLKGIAEPIHAYAVLQSTGVRSRLDVDPSTLTPLVGRDQELALLVDRWEHAQEGEGQGVLIAGEAGLGKSRLIQAFRERLAETPHTWLECRCTPYTRGSAFHPTVELVEQGLGFKPGDDPGMKLGRLERGIKRAGVSAPDAVPLVASLLSIPTGDSYPPLQLSPELQRKRTMDVLVAWILGLAEQQPLVMLYEDLHWCDPSTVELMGLAIEQGPTSRVLTLITFRPDFEPPWPARSHVTSVAVNRLSARQAKNMVGGMTRDVPLPEVVVERIAERADGIPLFVEELTKMVLESDIVVERDGRYELARPLTELAIPATLQDSLMARLDRLEGGKAVAQIGAALGREFFYELLRIVSPLENPRLQEGLDLLLDAELLYQRGVPPEATYTFKHAMIQDIAYQSLLKSARRQFHTRIAQVLEDEFPERVEAEPEVIARHSEEAGLTSRAIGHYQRAGERAVEQSANEEAIVHLRRALELVATLPESPERLEQELALQMAIATPLGAARGWSDPECEGAFTRARELVSLIGDVPELPRVLTGLAVSFSAKGDLAASAELASQALEAAERTKDPIHLLMAHCTVGNPLYWQGEVSRALEHFEHSIRLDDPGAGTSLTQSVGLDWGVMSRAFAAWCQCILGYPERALVTSDRAVALAEQLEHPIGLAQALSNRVAVHFMRREFDQARARAEEAIAQAERHGFPLFAGIARATRGWARALSGEGEEGVGELQRGIGGLAQIGMGVGAPTLLALLAEASWQVGRDDDALGALDVALARAQETGQHLWDAELHRMRGEILLGQDEAEAERAGALFRESLEIARRQKAKAWELRAATSLARLWQREDRRAEARDLLQPVVGWFTEGFDVRDLVEAKTLLDELT